MVKVTPDIPPEARSFVIAQIGSSYKNPVEALKEYVSNSIDNVLYNKLPSINVAILFNRRENRIIIQDDGTGITREELEMLPRTFGLSGKRYSPDAIGKKQFGLWSYLSFDPTAYMIIYTRPQVPITQEQTSYYHRARWPTFRQVLKGRDVDIDTITEKELEPQAPFKHGTRITLHNIPKGTFNHLLREGREELRTIYDPLIREGKIKIYVGYHNVLKHELLRPLEYQGNLILDEVIKPKISDKLIRDLDEEAKRGLPQELSIAYKLYINPTETTARLRNYNRGVLVQLLHQLFEFNTEPWVSGKLTGYINENFLIVGANRDSYVRNDLLDLFIVETKKFEPTLKKEVEKYSVVVTQPKEPSTLEKVKNRIDTFVSSIDTIFKTIKRDYPSIFGGRVLVEGTEEDPTMIVQRIMGLGVTRFPGKGEEKERKPIGRPIFKEEEEGEEKHVRGGRRFLSYTVDFTEFDLHKQSWQSDLDLLQEKIYINRKHSNFERLNKIGNEHELFSHVALLVSLGIARGEVYKACEKEGITDLTPYIHHITDIAAKIHRDALDRYSPKFDLIIIPPK